MTIDISRIRQEFPALVRESNGRPRIYFDNPGGTQVPKPVIDRTLESLVDSNANLGGHFATSVAADEITQQARAAMADFVGAASPGEIMFGQNMTTLTFHMSRTLGLTLGRGDEIVVTRMDHDANISPWLLLARDRGCTIRWFDFDPSTYEFDIADLERMLTAKTRIVALNYASNSTGTINDVRGICALVKARSPSALVYVDAVQFAPHGLIDVARLGCDFLVCSPYKFFGPHQGVLWGRSEVIEALSPYKVRPADDRIPYRHETGTLSHEGMAGTLGAVEYLEWVGKTMGRVTGTGSESPRRARLRAAWELLGDYEAGLCRQLIAGLERVPGLKIHGITDPQGFHRRVPTVSFTHDRLSPSALSIALGQESCFVWNGSNYAIEVTRTLGLLDSGGVLRVGLAHYNTAEEVETFLGLLDRIVKRNSIGA
ncbi:MAG: cysteine desulfurase-like protein [Parvibaculaceae bacterium]